MSISPTPPPTSWSNSLRLASPLLLISTMRTFHITRPEGWTRTFSLDAACGIRANLPGQGDTRVQYLLDGTNSTRKLKVELASLMSTVCVSTYDRRAPYQVILPLIPRGSHEGFNHPPSRTRVGVRLYRPPHRPLVTIRVGYAAFFSDTKHGVTLWCPTIA